MSDNIGVVIIGVVVIVIAICGVVFGAAQYVEQQDFIKEKHTCPNCGWEGYPGDMKIDRGHYKDNSVRYYCPECGGLIKQYYA